MPACITISCITYSIVQPNDEVFLYMKCTYQGTQYTTEANGSSDTTFKIIHILAIKREKFHLCMGINKHLLTKVDSTNNTQNHNKHVHYCATIIWWNPLVVQNRILVENGSILNDIVLIESFTVSFLESEGTPWLNIRNHAAYDHPCLLDLPSSVIYLSKINIQALYFRFSHHPVTCSSVL